MNAPVLLVGPAGSGKTTLLNRVRDLKLVPMVFPVSCTTRTPRQGEVHGVNYYFFDRSEFERMIAAGDFLEWAEVHGNLYGTLKSEMLRAVKERNGSLVCRDVDIQGAKELKKEIPGTVTIFIAPGSAEELSRRILSDKTRDASVDPVEVRLRTAVGEMAEVEFADYLIVNSDGALDHALFELSALLRCLRFGWEPSLIRFRNPTLMRRCLSVSL